MPLAVFLGLILAVGYMIYAVATLRSIGAFGIALIAAIFGAGLWVLADWGVLTLTNPSLNLWLGILVLSLILGIGGCAILIALGIWLAWILTEGGEKLLVTTYGLLLLAKLAIGVIAIGVGALNKQVITAKVAADPATGKKWLRVALLCEATLFAAAIIAVSAATTIGAPAG